MFMRYGGLNKRRGSSIFSLVYGEEDSDTLYASVWLRRRVRSGIRKSLGSVGVLSIEIDVSGGGSRRLVHPALSCSAVEVGNVVEV